MPDRPLSAASQVLREFEPIGVTEPQPTMADRSGVFGIGFSEL
jgi:hypothetical protein